MQEATLEETLSYLSVFWRKMEWRYTPEKPLFTLHPFWLVFIVAAVRSDRPKTLETTVSSTHMPLLVFCEILDGLLEMLNKLVCPWWLTLKASVLLQFLLNTFDLQKVLFLEWVSRLELPLLKTNLKSDTDSPLYSPYFKFKRTYYS